MTLRGISPGAQLIGFVVCLLGLIAGLGNVPLTRAQDQPRTDPVGTFVDANYVETFSHIRTRVQTTQGVYLVDGAFQGLRGRSLVVRTDARGGQALCDADQQECHSLLR